VDESDVLAELFGATRDDFLTIRKERAAEAKADGDRDLAQRITALRKPTVAAWLVNQVMRRYPEDADALTDVARSLGDAQRQGAGDDLRAAGKRRRELLLRLERRVRDLAADTGTNLSADAVSRIDTMFQAALVDENALAQVVAGTLSTDVAMDPGAATQWTTVSRPKLRLVRDPEPDSEPEPDAEPDPRLPEARARAAEAAKAEDRAAADVTKAQRRAQQTEEALAKARAALEAAQEKHYGARDELTAAKEVLTKATRAAKAADTEVAKLERA
jgi:hypothetical protein